MGVCDSAHPGCRLPEELFLDNKPLQRMTYLGAVSSGKWYFDYGQDKIYMANDPNGHKVEISWNRTAFAGRATGVVIRGVTVEKYAPPAQTGAVGDQFPPTDWTVEYCDIRLNHGVGLTAGSRWKIRYNKTYDNGHMGFRGTGDDILIEGNEIYGNNRAGFSVGWEAGGFKFSYTNRLIIRGNTSHDNFGLGMWTDIDNINTTYENNNVYANKDGGISHEISYAAVIRNNTVTNNGSPRCVWIWGGQIQIQNSQDVEVYGNKVSMSSVGCSNGINMIYQNRGSGRYGPYLTVDNYVHNNTIKHNADAGFNGGGADYNTSTMWNGNNRFDYNTYNVPDINKNRWEWRGSWTNWYGFKSRGQEVHGTAY
jgi:hypothetical protein